MGLEIYEDKKMKVGYPADKCVTLGSEILSDVHSLLNLN